MVRVKLLATAILVLGGAAAGAADVAVPGSPTKYPPALDATVAGKSVSLTLTGVALRQKLIFNVYAIGSYVQAGVTAGTAEELAAVDCVKRLHLVMERDVSGKDMAAAFQDAIRKNHPAPAFDAEVGQLVRAMQGHDALKGDHIFLTHVPGDGLHCQIPGKVDFVIRTPQFSKAVWDIYLGQSNLGESIKKGLTSRR
jgi:hypothetical protein